MPVGIAVDVPVATGGVRDILPVDVSRQEYLCLADLDSEVHGLIHWEGSSKRFLRVPPSTNSVTMQVISSDSPKSWTVRMLGGEAVPRLALPA